MAREITTDNLQGLLDGDKPVVIDFWAEWCGPCRAIAPMIEQLHEEYGDRVVIGKCDVESNDEVVTKYSIRTIPTVLFIKNGKVADKQVGMTNKKALKEKIEALL